MCLGFVGYWSFVFGLCGLLVCLYDTGCFGFVCVVGFACCCLVTVTVLVVLVWLRAGVLVNSVVVFSFFNLWFMRIALW